jgi:hypothetical protein
MEHPNLFPSYKEQFTRIKHSSLFYYAIFDEEKMFFFFQFFNQVFSEIAEVPLHVVVVVAVAVVVVKDPHDQFSPLLLHGRDETRDF